MIIILIIIAFIVLAAIMLVRGDRDDTSSFDLALIVMVALAVATMWYFAIIESVKLSQ